MSHSCNDTQAIVENLWFWSGEVLKLVCAPTAIVWNCLLIFVLRKSTALHINVHILLINISFCAMLSSIVLFAKSVFTFVVVMMGHVCWIRVPYHKLCQFQTGMFFVTHLPIFGSTVMLGFERLYATLNIDNYEGESGACLARVCVTLLWIVSIKLSVSLLITVPDNAELAYCNGLFMLHRNAIAVLAAVLPLFIFFGTLLYVLIWLTNRRLLKRYWINQARYSLAGRLQRQHNIVVTEMMLPSILLQAICWTIIMCAVAIPRLRNFQDDEHPSSTYDLIIAQYTVYLVALIHMNLHPMLCIWYGKVFHNECRKLFPFTSSWWPTDAKNAKHHNPSEPTKETEQHFQLLDYQWKKAEAKFFRESRRASKKAARLHHERYVARRHSAGDALKRTSPSAAERFKSRHRSSVIIQSEPVSYAPNFASENDIIHV